MKVFKSKVLYIILLVIFTLILIGTLVIRFALPSVPGGFSRGFGSQTDSNMPTNFSPPSDFGTSGREDGNTGSSRPDMPEGFNFEGSDSGNFDPENMGSGSFTPGMQRSGGFTSTVKKIWIPVTIVCVLADAFCIFMIIRISRSRRQAQVITEDNNAENAPRRKSRKMLWFLLIIPVLAAAILLKTLSSFKQSILSDVNVKEKVITAEAATKDLSTVYLAGGTLAGEDSQVYSLPGEIDIESYAVKSGENVKAGDLIATVNKASVMSEINEITSLISDLDKELKETKEDDNKKITAPAAGRVKAVFAKAGTSVIDTMTENNALMLLSLDGLMKVEINADLSVGDKVDVALSDGSTETGRISSSVGGVVTVTLSDKNAAYGEEVTVLNSDGSVIGKGQLSINSCLAVIGYQGIVNQVHV